MTATELVNSLLHARPVGDGRWMARCPAHNDRSPSLSIRTGRDGRVLVRCWAGCRTEHVLAKLGLSWKHICGEPMTSSQIRKAAVERQERELHRMREHAVELLLFDRIRKLYAILDELGSRLANNPDAPGSDAIAQLFHQTLEKIREAEATVIV